MEKKIITPKEIPITWVYTGITDTQNPEFPPYIKPNSEFLGKMGVSFAPGKKNKFVGHDGIKHNRSLAWDISNLASRGVNAIFCLLGKYELKFIGVDLSEYEKLCAKHGITFCCFPIVDMSIPEPKETEKFKQNVIQKIVELVKNNKNILIHCRGGIGRACTVAGCALAHIYNGVSSEAIIKLLRRKRAKDAVQSYKQVDFIKKYMKEISVTYS